MDEVSDVKKAFLSSTLGSNMVLQRAPQKAVVWGFTQPGATVNTTFAKTTLPMPTPMSTTADADGVWRQELPATEASEQIYSLSFSSSAGETAQMENVLFGDVYLCGGQSNMVFAMPNITNASEEIARANDYPMIRLFSVGQHTQSSTPLDDLQRIEETWSVASNTSVAHGDRFGYFSAVCWIYGRELFDALDGKVPIGLISNNWGGTKLESWTTPEALEACNHSESLESSSVPVGIPPDFVLYNAMIHPYVVGPMSLTGFAWYQGEQNVGGKGSAEKYACTFPAMISAWRKLFQNPDTYFGFIQLSTWCGNPEQIAEMRTIGQMSALALPKVGYATNADHGGGCMIHPEPKQYCAQRLAKSALALQYGEDIEWKSPTFKASTASASPPSVLVTLNDVSASGLRDDQYPFNAPFIDCDSGKGQGKCAWAELQSQDGTWTNATVTVESSSTLRLTAIQGSDVDGAPVASRYGWCCANDECLRQGHRTASSSMV